MLAWILPALSACGFEPVYGNREGRQRVASLEEIVVSPIPDRSGQILRNYLLDYLTPHGAASAKKYRLQIRLNESPQILALRRDDVISRAGYSATALYSLQDIGGRVLMTGSASSVSDFEISDSERATFVARESARERLMQTLAEDIRQQLAARIGDIKRAEGAP